MRLFVVKLLFCILRMPRYPLSLLELTLAVGPFSLQVTDSSGHLLYSRDDAKKGKFAFTTDDYEIYEICFESHGQPGMGAMDSAGGFKFQKVASNPKFRFVFDVPAQ